MLSLMEEAQGKCSRATSLAERRTEKQYSADSISKGTIFQGSSLVCVA